MDLARRPAQLLARPVAALLGLEGETPDQRRAELMEYLTLPGVEVEDLGLRHVARAMAWLVLLGVAVVLAVIPLTLIAVFAGSSDDLLLSLVTWPIFFIFFMCAVHMLKMAIAYYLPERWWNRERLFWRVAMLAQLPDIVIAISAATVITWPAGLF